MNALEFDCPHCQQTLEAPGELQGRRVDCPACNGSIMVPDPPYPSTAGSPVVNHASRSAPLGDRSSEGVEAFVQLCESIVSCAVSSARLLFAELGQYSMQDEGSKPFAMSVAYFAYLTINSVLYTVHFRLRSKLPAEKMREALLDLVGLGLAMKYSDSAEGRKPILESFKQSFETFETLCFKWASPLSSNDEFDDVLKTALSGTVALICRVLQREADVEMLGLVVEITAQCMTENKIVARLDEVMDTP